MKVVRARCLRALTAAMTLPLALACGIEEPSPLDRVPDPPKAPPTATVTGDVVWFGDDGKSFRVDYWYMYSIVEIDESTSFIGALRSVDDMGAMYSRGYRLPVTVVGVGDPPDSSTPLRMRAISVDAQATETRLGGSSLWRVRNCDAQYAIIVLDGCTRCAVFVSRWTAIDPTGDFATVDTLVAAMARDEVRYVSGEWWYSVSRYGTHAKTLKATRQPH